MTHLYMFFNKISILKIYSTILTDFNQNYDVYFENYINQLEFKLLNLSNINKKMGLELMTLNFFFIKICILFIMYNVYTYNL